MSEERFIDKEKLLEPETMLMLYARGAFPMAENNEINWYMPETRTIIPLYNFNVPRSLKKFMSECDFVYKYDISVMEVVKNCSNRNETWISDRLIKAYEGLQKTGHLHSVEVYQKNKLIGGLYGVTYRGAFFGESMFSKVSQASKAALVKLVERLKEKNFSLLDVQYPTEHLEMFGALEISFEEYTEFLLDAYSKDVFF